MARLRLSLACGDYDRTRALEEATVVPDGIALTYLRLPVEETFFRMLRHREFDVAEMSLSTYATTLATDERPFVAIPVFTSRMFRHSGAYVHAEAGLARPADLVGRVVGTPELQLTAGVWIRGILADRHDLPVDSVSYVTGGLENPGRIEKGRVTVPYDVRAAPPGRTLSSMLLSGEIDALYSPRAPRAFHDGDPRVRRLFPDVIAVEQAYFADTAIFPIMHVVVLRREIHEHHPWVARSLTKAFGVAKDLARARLWDTSAPAFLSPWLTLHAEADVAALGADFWSYGLDGANRATLDTFLRYHHDQGLSPARLAVDDLFVPASTESFVI